MPEHPHRPEAGYALTLLRGWLQGEGIAPLPAEDVDAARFQALVQKNRLEGLMGALLPGRQREGWEAVRTLCTEAYRRNLLHGLRQLGAGSELAAQFEAAGVACLAMRGPFAGADIYGDVGVRRFTDIDLYIPARQRRAAWNVALSAGYRLVRRELPRGFYERHHLHWPLAKSDGSTSCDLHWALDHPYKLQRVDYDTFFAAAEKRAEAGLAWRQPAPGHLLLAAVMHLGKHCREGQALAFGEDGGWAVAERGWLAYWLEIAAIVRRYGERLDWDELERTARAWRVDAAYRAALAGVSAFFGSPVPPVDIRGKGQSNVSSARPAPDWVRDISRLGGFQNDRVSDARRYLFPPADYFADKDPATRVLHRAFHTAQAAPRLLLATGEALVWPAWAKLKHGNRPVPKPGDTPDATVETGDRK